MMFVYQGKEGHDRLRRLALGWAETAEKHAADTEDRYHGSKAQYAATMATMYASLLTAERLTGLTPLDER